jgi:hypothetical protein
MNALCYSQLQKLVIGHVIFLSLASTTAYLAVRNFSGLDFLVPLGANAVSVRLTHQAPNV